MCVTFQDWSLQYNPEEPVAPRYDVNAPDLYIPGESFAALLVILVPAADAVC